MNIFKKIYKKITKKDEFYYWDRYFEMQKKYEGLNPMEPVQEFNTKYHKVAQIDVNINNDGDKKIWHLELKVL
jgi:hypothetical protein